MMSSRIHLRPPELADQRHFLAMVRRSKSLHRPWVSAPSTPGQFREYLDRIAKPENAGFIVSDAQSGALVGVINVSNIVLGSFRSAYLGYYVFEGHQRKGFMKEGIRAVVRLAFHTRKLHRLEANIQPANKASIALAKSCGFELEGYSRRYLKINGRWRDHERWAIRSS